MFAREEGFCLPQTRSSVEEILLFCPVLHAPSLLSLSLSLSISTMFSLPLISSLFFFIVPVETKRASRYQDPRKLSRLPISPVSRAKREEKSPRERQTGRRSNERRHDSVFILYFSSAREDNIMNAKNKTVLIKFSFEFITKKKTRMLDRLMIL